MIFEEQLQQLADTAKGEQLAEALMTRFAADPEDAETWLAVFALEDHPRLRKESVWQPLLISLGEVRDRVGDPQLAWEATVWLTHLRLRFDSSQNATCELTSFLSRHPTHEEALDELVYLVCHEDGDYREASWCVDDLAKLATEPRQKARALLAQALMYRSAFPSKLAQAQALLAQARETYLPLDGALMRQWAERSRCSEDLDAMLGSS
jgi:hypothetical protein